MWKTRKFDKDFTLIVLSDYSLDEVIKAAESVSEIAQVTGACSGAGEDQELSFRRGDSRTRTGEKGRRSRRQRRSLRKEEKKPAAASQGSGEEAGEQAGGEPYRTCGHRETGFSDESRK